MRLPAEGASRDEVMAALRAARANDVRWREGRVFSLVYWCGDDVLDLAKEAAAELFCENALNPTAFPSLRRFETEVVQMVAALLGHPDAAGTMTSGGTESILMAVKTARDHARATRPHLGRPNVVLPSTAHPAFDKAGAYFGVDMIHVPVDESLRVDLAAVERAITDDTILLVGSAPAYPHGVIDPIVELGAIASARGLLLHVDACVGGMLLPFLERLGDALPPFDFRVPGVTSMSADLHKYGWTAKGASVVLYRTRALRQHQFVVYPDWPGGLYGSPSMPGTRPGGPIAAAWAVMRHLGEAGYLRHARTTIETARRLIDGVRAIPGLFVFGEPQMSVFAVGSHELDVYAVGDRMQARGWLLDRQQRPPSLHLTVTPLHAPHVGAILDDLRASVDEVRAGGPSAASGGAAAMYGMLGALPDRAQVGDFVREFLDGLDRV
jgi:glutamate/tyrosine decarboxylase-like PLP-dependent enzyme